MSFFPNRRLAPEKQEEATKTTGQLRNFHLNRLFITLRRSECTDCICCHLRLPGNRLVPDPDEEAVAYFFNIYDSRLLRAQILQKEAPNSVRRRPRGHI